MEMDVLDALIQLLIYTMVCAMCAQLPNIGLELLAKIVEKAVLLAMQMGVWNASLQPISSMHSVTLAHLPNTGLDLLAKTVIQRAMDAARLGAQRVHHQQHISLLVSVTLAHHLSFGMDLLAAHAQQAAEAAVDQQQAALNAQTQTI